MSKNLRPILHILAAAAYILQFFTISYSQTLNIRLSVDADAGKAVVEGSIPEAGKRNRRNLAFVQNYAGVGGIAARISDVSAFGADRQAVGVKRFIPGEYVAAADMAGWGYTLDLRPMEPPASRAHISWLDGNVGVLFPYDMLPQVLGDAAPSSLLALSLPEGWNVATGERRGDQGSYLINDPRKAAFLIWKSGAVRTVRGRSLSINVAGKWQFTDAEAVEAADAIMGDYERLFGSRTTPAQVTLIRLPSTAVGMWEADTRGRNVTIVAGDTPFASQAIQRLHEQLRHELFHLWFPEGVSLSGDYDWFYEGFALYESLKLGVRENRITFQDMLDSIAAAYKLDSSRPTRKSLIAESADRWNGASHAVYSRGMLAAFLIDVAMLQASGGKRSVEGLIREAYNDALRQPGRDGNDVILAAMRRRPEILPIIDRYIVGAAEVDWTAALRSAGIDESGPNAARRLTATAKPDGGQRTLLDKLGYNNWRKLSEKP